MNLIIVQCTYIYQTFIGCRDGFIMKIISNDGFVVFERSDFFSLENIIFLVKPYFFTFIVNYIIY